MAGKRTRGGGPGVAQLFLALCCAATAMAATASAQAAETGDLFLQGEGSVLAEFDRVKLTVTLSAKTKGANSAQLSQERNKESLTNFTESLYALGVEQTNVSTRGLDLSPEVKWDKGRSEVVGYQSTVRAEVDMGIEQSKALVPQIYNLASGMQGKDVQVSVDSLQPYVSHDKKKKLLTKLVADAVDDASMKAKLYANAMGRDLGPVLVMSESPLQSRPQPRDPPAPMMMRGAVGGAPMAEDAEATVVDIPLGKGRRLKKVLYFHYQLL